MITDEDIIKRRLLIDGDGTGDDRRLNVLQKAIIKWCNANESPEESQTSLDSMLVQIALCESSVAKSLRVTEMSNVELQNYQNLSKKIKEDIGAERKTVDKTKQELAEARTVKKYKMQYDLLGSVISDQPDRKDTGRKLEELKNDLKNLKECKAQIEKKLALRRQQFHALVVTIHQLQHTLDEDEMEVTASVDDSDVMELEATDKNS